MANVLEVNSLSMNFNTEQGIVKALNNLNFHVKKGETVALVGESGSGKSITSLSIMGLIRKHTGQVEGMIRFKDKILNQLSEKEMRSIRGREISMIFQEPMTSLNPVHTIGKQIGEIFRIHSKLPKKEIQEKTIEILKKVGIPRPEKIINEYPHQLSGGMKQRVMISIAMACNPDLLIADEPTTALDVTIQAQILDLMNDLKHNYNTSMLLITHDLGVVAEMADRVLVMYYGEIVEEAEIQTLFSEPKHPYTLGLLHSIPKMEEDLKRLQPIEGHVPALGEIVQGCPFRDRCKFIHNKCMTERPPLIKIGNQSVRCWLYASEEIDI